MNRNQRLEESRGQAAREMSCSSPVGLEFLCTRLIEGRTQENDLVKLMGGQGAERANLHDFKDTTAKRKMREAGLHCTTALNGVFDRDFIHTVPPHAINEDQSAAPADQITTPVAGRTGPTVVTPFDNSGVVEGNSDAEEGASLLGTHSAPWVTSNDLDPLDLMKSWGVMMILALK